MSPAEHYNEAERLLDKAAEAYQLAADAVSAGHNATGRAVEYTAIPSYLVAKAQVHATLATVGMITAVQANQPTGETPS